jgi:hypothetical protein
MFNLEITFVNWPGIVPAFCLPALFCIGSQNGFLWSVMSLKGYARITESSYRGGSCRSGGGASITGGYRVWETRDRSGFGSCMPSCGSRAIELPPPDHV